MPAITALIHTNNDALRLGRALETLYPCDEIVIVDHGSRDGTASVAREYGATVVEAGGGTDVHHDLPLQSTWVLCLDPRESLTEGLAASLYEWKTEHIEGSAPAFSVFLREETADGWIENPTPQTRLVAPGWNRWLSTLPANDNSAVALEGELLRFIFP